MSHLMLDLETLSTRHDAVILSIGACIFDPHAQDDSIIDTFYQVVSAASQPERHISGATVEWWFQQSNAAREALLIDQTNLHNALKQFIKWVGRHRPTAVWANSPSFDCVILKHACEHHQVHWPFKFWEERDVRTAKDLAYPNGDAPDCTVNGVAHNAQADAIAQARLVQRCYSALNKGK